MARSLRSRGGGGMSADNEVEQIDLLGALQRSLSRARDARIAALHSRTATKPPPDDESPAEPLGPWQTASLTLTRCTRRQGRCAYRAGDPERCDGCHVEWSVITGAWGESRTAHVHPERAR